MFCDEVEIFFKHILISFTQNRYSLGSMLPKVLLLNWSMMRGLGWMSLKRGLYTALWTSATLEAILCCWWMTTVLTRWSESVWHMHFGILIVAFWWCCGVLDAFARLCMSPVFGLFRFTMLNDAAKYFLVITIFGDFLFLARWYRWLI